MYRIIAILFAVFIAASTFAQDQEIPEWKKYIIESVQLNAQNQYDSAFVASEKSLELATDIYGARDTLIAKILYQQGRILMNLAKFEAAEPKLLEAISIIKERLPGESQYLAKFSNALGFVYDQRSEFGKAESLYVSALSYYQDLPNSNQDDFANTLDNLGGLYMKLGRLDEARDLLNRSLRIREEMYGGESDVAAEALYELGDLERESGNFIKSVEHLKRALEIFQGQESVDQRRVATVLNFLGNTYFQVGFLTEADSIYRRALEKFTEIHGPVHTDVAAAHHNIGLVLMDDGDYFAAEPHLTAALEIYRKVFGRTSADAANVALSLGNLYDYIGDADRSHKMFFEALSLQQKIFGAGHEATAVGLNNLGHYHLKHGDLDSARVYFKDALDVLTSSPTERSQEFIIPLHNLALVALKQNHLADAALYASRALEISREVYGESHPDNARNQMALAAALSKSEPDSAEALFEASIEGFKTSLGEQHPDLADCLGRYATFESSRQNHEKAFGLRADAFDILHHTFVSNVGFLPEYQALNYARATRVAAESVIGAYFALESQDEDQTRAAIEVMLASKGLVSDQMIARSIARRTAEDSVLNSLYEQWRSKKALLVDLYFSSEKQIPGLKRAQRIRQYSSEVAELEGQLARAGARMASSAIGRVSMAELMGKLPDGLTLIEYLRIGFTHMPGEPVYAAAVLTPRGDARLLLLESAGEIDRLVESYRVHMARLSGGDEFPSETKLAEYRKIGGPLFDAVLAPVADNFEEQSVLCFAPDGALNLIAFSTLVQPDERFLVEGVAVHQVSTGRDFMRFDEPSAASSGILALGGPDFDWSSGPDEVAESGVTKRSIAVERLRNLCPDFAGFDLKPLPKSAEEARSVAAIWTDLTGGEAIILTGRDASKPRLEAAISRQACIHLATHGFFVRGDCRGDGGERTIQANPLLFSGLVLAGADRPAAFQDSLGLDDGILSAYEIAEFDLTGNRLVVLSACESGAGEIEDGEGVYGLRRAFQTAGAATVVSALWPVDDALTASMMKSVYETSDRIIAERIRNAQLVKIGELRRAGLPAHPLLWGAWITQGDWR